MIYICNKIESEKFLKDTKDNNGPSIKPWGTLLLINKMATDQEIKILPLVERTTSTGSLAFCFSL